MRETNIRDGQPFCCNRCQVSLFHFHLSEVRVHFVSAEVWRVCVIAGEQWQSSQSHQLVINTEERAANETGSVFLSKSSVLLLLITLTNLSWCLCLGAPHEYFIVLKIFRGNISLKYDHAGMSHSVVCFFKSQAVGLWLYFQIYWCLVSSLILLFNFMGALYQRVVGEAAQEFFFHF